MYIKGYKQRVATITLAVAVVLMSSLLCYFLFHNQLNKIGGQLNSYDSADYSIIYILNYGERLNNECIYPDTDIQFYQDAEKSLKLTVSSIMREENVLYDLAYLSSLSGLNSGEVCISQNVADKYNLTIGDVLFAEYSYSSEPVPLKVSSIMPTELDYVHPNIDNDIGMVFFGYNSNYAINMKSKYILFAEKSKTDDLAVYPQIISEVINKATNIDDVSYQGMPALLIETLFSLASVIIAQIVFFSKSRLSLYRCYLKGMRRIVMPVISLIERLFFCLLPCVTVQYAVTLAIPDSSVTRVYRMIPISICGAFCIIMFAVDSLKSGRKGRCKWNF